MSRLMQQAGVPKTAILLENRAGDTYENLAFSQKIMQEQGLRSAIIVSEPYHLPRADLIATKLGILHSVSPAKKSVCWSDLPTRLPLELREVGALIYFRLLNRL